MSARGELVVRRLQPLEPLLQRDLQADEALPSRRGLCRGGAFRRVMEVNYLGYVHGTLEALARMRPRNQGTIVQVGSALAYRGIPLQAPCCASKQAIQGFMDSLRSELLAEHSGVKSAWCSCRP